MAIKKTTTLGISAAALALVGGLGFAGVASAADSSTSTPGAATGTTQPAPTERGGHGGHRGANQAERTAALASKLDAAVTAGTLTQAEANAVTQAVDAGVIGERQPGKAALMRRGDGPLVQFTGPPPCP